MSIRDHHFVICYDIPSDKRRRHLAKKLLNFGDRVQYSVFEAILTESQFQTVKKECLKILDPKFDSLKFYRMPSLTEDRVHHFGQATLYKKTEAQVF